MPTHAVKRVLPFSRAQLFALVADVEKYPEFLPWCVGARITRRQDTVFWADLIIGFRMFREKFTSRVTLDADRRIDVEYTNGPFRYLNNHWIFLEAGNPDHCLVDFYVDFEFKNRLFQKMIGSLFNEAVRRMVDAFEHRAEALYK